MPGISAAAMLDLWEAAGRLGPVERALALAAAAEPAAADELARLPLGRRDARILELVAGRALEATALCPACGEQAEFAVDAAALVSRDAASTRRRRSTSADPSCTGGRSTAVTSPPLAGAPTPQRPSACCSRAA